MHPYTYTNMSTEKQSLPGSSANTNRSNRMPASVLHTCVDGQQCWQKASYNINAYTIHVVNTLCSKLPGFFGQSTRN